MHQSWNTTDGLPQNSVTSVLQRRKGYLWLGTPEGLASFGGVSFTLYDSRNSREISTTRSWRWWKTRTKPCGQGLRTPTDR